MTPKAEELLQVAVRAARAGGAELMARLRTERQIDFKGGTDLVTDADRASEARVVEVVRQAWPDHAVLAEEGGYTPGSGGVRWIIDPLDGTTNYAHRVPHWCVSVAAEGPSGALAGVVYDPLRDELFEAGLGLGARLNGVPLAVSATAELSQSLLATGFPYDLWANPEEPLSLFDRFCARSRGMRRMGSAALDLAYVAAGRFDGFYEYRLKAWDVAAGQLLVREAGGTVTHLEGGPLDLADCDVLGTNTKLHAPMLEVVRERLAPEVG